MMRILTTYANQLVVERSKRKKKKIIEAMEYFQPILSITVLFYFLFLKINCLMEMFFLFVINN